MQTIGINMNKCLNLKVPLRVYVKSCKVFLRRAWLWDKWFNPDSYPHSPNHFICPHVYLSKAFLPQIIEMLVIRNFGGAHLGFEYCWNTFCYGISCIQSMVNSGTLHYRWVIKYISYLITIGFKIRLEYLSNVCSMGYSSKEIRLNKMRWEKATLVL